MLWPPACPWCCRLLAVDRYNWTVDTIPPTATAQLPPVMAPGVARFRLACVDMFPCPLFHYRLAAIVADGCGGGNRIEPVTAWKTISGNKTVADGGETASVELEVSGVADGHFALQVGAHFLLSLGGTPNPWKNAPI